MALHSLIPLSLLFSIVYAEILPFHVNIGNPNPSILRRDPTQVGITNVQNAQYVSNMTIGGVSVPVLLDTGSSDLWAYFPTGSPQNLQDTGKSVTLSYAVGKATGNAKTATVQMGNTTVQNQVFLHVTDTSTFTSSIASQGYSGLLGLGPNDGSVIYKKLDKKDADSNFLQRVFEADTTHSPYITFLLDRKGPNQTYTGQFTVAEPVPGFEQILNMPQLDVEKVNKLLESDQHWQALTDENVGIIGPDGNPIQIKSIVPKAPKGQLVAVIDSGFTFSQVPRDIADAIYGRVKGAYYDSTHEYWLLPCGQYLNISFNFGGINYPIHPLDTVDDNFNVVDPTGKKVCIGAFQPITSAFSLLGHYDMILGMSFLRNAYTLLNFGNWVDGVSKDSHPYVQMVATTSSPTGRSDFVKVRLGGNDTISTNPQWALLPADQMVHSPISAEEKKKKYQEMVLSRWPYILLGCLALVVISVGLCIWKCCFRNRGKKNGGLLGNTKLGFMRRNKGVDGKGEEGLPAHGGLSTKESKERERASIKASSVHAPPSYQQNSVHGHNGYAGSQRDLHGDTASTYSYNGANNNYNQGSTTNLLSNSHGYNSSSSNLNASSTTDLLASGGGGAYGYSHSGPTQPSPAYQYEQGGGYGGGYGQQQQHQQQYYAS